MANVQNAVQNWGYYILTIRRSEADLVVFVRKGRVVNIHSANSAGNGIPSSRPLSPSQKPEAGFVPVADSSPNIGHDLRLLPESARETIRPSLGRRI